MNEIYLCTKWMKDDEGTNLPEASGLIVSNGGRWQDYTAQPAENLPTDPNIYIVKAWVDNALLSSLETDARFVLLATQNNLKERMGKPKSDELKAEIKTRFPDVRDNHLAGFGAGLSRDEAIKAVIAIWRHFPKAIPIDVPEALSFDEVPSVSLLGKEIPISSKWTWKNIIQPIIKRIK